jgi:hypothetical protein
VGVAGTLAAGLAWHMTHPTSLPGPDGHVETRARLGTPVYVGVPTGRAITIRSWALDVGHAQSELLVCRDGSVGTTSSVEPFCSRVDPADGAHLTATDSLVLELSSTTYSLVEGGPLHLAWRDGIQFGEMATGPTFSVLVTQ